MGLFIPKNKARTPQQQLVRFYMGIGVILFMAIVVASSDIKGRRQRRQAERTMEKIERQLDSALEARFPGSEVVQRGRMEFGYVEFPADTLREGELAYAEIDPQLALDIQKRIRERNEERKHDAIKIENGNYYTRRVTFVTPDGRTISGFQKTDEGITHTDLIYLIERSTATVDIDEQIGQIEEIASEQESQETETKDSKQ